MRKFVGLTTQLLEETGTLAVLECLFVEKNYVTGAELWVDEVYEMTAV
jgi:hypothetical protein